MRGEFPPKSHDNPQCRNDIDIRDLTLVGKGFGLLSVGLVIGGAIAFYNWQPIPRFLGLHIYGTGEPIENRNWSVHGAVPVLIVDPISRPLWSSEHRPLLTVAAFRVILFRRFIELR